MRVTVVERRKENIPRRIHRGLCSGTKRAARPNLFYFSVLYEQINKSLIGTTYILNGKAHCAASSTLNRMR